MRFAEVIINHSTSVNSQDVNLSRFSSYTVACWTVCLINCFTESNRKTAWSCFFSFVGVGEHIIIFALCSFGTIEAPKVRFFIVWEGKFVVEFIFTSVIEEAPWEIGNKFIREVELEIIKEFAILIDSSGSVWAKF